MPPLQASVTLQSAATTGSGTVGYLRGSTSSSTFYVTGNGTIDGGSVQLETSETSDYSGTWASIASAITASALSGNKKSITVVAGPLIYVRARIASDITGGGTVSVSVVGV